MRKIVVCLMAMLAFASGRTAAQAPFGQYSKQPWEAKYYQTSIDSDETPGTDWYQPEFDDSEWEQISGPISNTDAMYHATRWEPEGTVYWVRRHFMLESIDTDKFYLLHVVHDDGCVMYLNGNLIYENEGVRGDTEYVLVFDQEKLSYLKEGDNLLSVKVGNTGRGDAYMDFGLYALDAIPVTRIDLSVSNITLKINELARLSATTNADATNPSLVWSVADSTIATVTMDGLVQGVKAGTTTVTVYSTDNPDIVASCTVNVSSETAPVTILPWGKVEPWTMKYLYYELADYKDPQMDENGKEWTELDYDDAAWNSLTGPMASRDIWYSNWNYLWEGEYNCFCLRRTFTLSQVDKGFYVFQMQHDDDIRVYLNGQLVINEQGCTDANVSSYVIANDLFVEGENVLSIYIQNNSVNGFLDYSLVYQESGDYNVTAKSNGNGRVDGAGGCVANSKVMLTAIPDDGYRFVRWEDGSTENPRFLHVTEDREVSATFEEVPYYENMILSYGQWSQTPWSAKYYQTHVDDGLSPADNWYAPDFDDSQWEQISGPISNQSSLYHATRWEPEKTIYWVRRHFTMESVDPDKAYMLPIIHDDGCMVYLNGHLIYERGEVVGNADNRCYLSGEKASYLREGDNILAVMVSDAGGVEAYMDFGIYAGNPVTELTLSHSAISVRKGTRMSLEALVNEDAFDESLSWSIADGNVASVVEDGIIYGNNVGQTTLTVTSLSNPEVSATCQIYVYEPDALQWILPWGKDEAWSMRYRRYELADYEEPAADANGKRWTEAGYNDAAWETLSGPMASEHVWYGSGNYLWEGENNCYCLRRTFTLQNAEKNSTYYFYTQHDDDIKVYVNGNLIVERSYYNAEEAGIYLIPSELLVVGENTLAIYIQQLVGDAYLDYAIGAEVKATHLTLSEENLTLKINEEAQLTATVDGTTSGVCWSVADGTIVSVTAEGKVRGKKTGTTTITATAISNPSVAATCTVTVTSEYAPLATGWLQPMGEEYPWTMRYQYYELADAASPADDSKGLHWYEVGYDDAEWQTLIGPLGGTTPWEGDNNCYYLRGTFVLPENAHGSLQFYAKHDDGIRVYINGVMVRDHGYDMGLHEFAIPDTLLHQGDNTIAVYAQEEGGEAYFDYGLYFTEASMCTVTVTSEGGGTVHGGGQYKIGVEVTLTAVPDEGYYFVRWSDGSTENPRTIKVETDVELFAEFYPVDIPEIPDVKLQLNETADTYILSEYTGTGAEHLVIPSEVHGIPVTTIGGGAFMGATDLKSIVIPSSVTKVGDKAFGGCSNLLVVEWNSSAPVKSECFDDPASHGNMLVFVPAGATVTYEGNVIVGGVAEKITLIDGMPLRNPRDFIAQRVEYSREFTKQTYLGTTSGWEAMVLPFDVQRVVSETKGELKPFGEADFIASLPYWLAELQENGTFVAVQTITANKPFIMQLPNSEEYEEQYNVTGIVTFSAENATVCATTGTAPTTKGYTLQGSYEGTAAARDVYAINDEEYSADGDTYMPGGVFVANSRDIRPFEAYVYSNHAAPAPYLRIGGKGSTGIGHSTLKAQPSAIYDLMGRKVLKSEMLKKGIYIVNGKLNLKN